MAVVRARISYERIARVRRNPLTAPAHVGATGLPDHANRVMTYHPADEPIDSTRFGSLYDDTGAAGALRDDVKHAILTGIRFLRDQRDLDPNRGVMTRLRRRTD